MSRFTGTALAMAAGTLLTGCLATQSQLRHEADERTIAVNTERSARMASDSALAQQLGMVRGDVQLLRRDLDSMRTEFNAKIVAMEDGLKFALPVTFAFNRADLGSDTQPALARFARIAQSYYPGARITVEGFADPAGSAQYNLALSKRRAETVRQYLVSQASLTGNEIQAVGYGESRLVTPGAWGDRAGAELNRRVVFVIESAGSRDRTVAMSSTTP